MQMYMLQSYSQYMLTQHSPGYTKVARASIERALVSVVTGALGASSLMYAYINTTWANKEQLIIETLNVVHHGREGGGQIGQFHFRREFVLIAHKYTSWRLSLADIAALPPQPFHMYKWVSIGPY